uniref:Peptidase A2 domain-containing protein n=1 Tax=Steinernema glaseri TaxID=37863 RepID=A0A1I8AUQ9_9BILA
MLLGTATIVKPDGTTGRITILIDTGANQTVITESASDRFGLQLGGTAKNISMGTASGTVTVETFRCPVTLKTDTDEIKDIVATSMPCVWPEFTRIRPTKEDVRFLASKGLRLSETNEELRKNRGFDMIIGTDLRTIFSTFELPSGLDAYHTPFGVLLGGRKYKKAYRAPAKKRRLGHSRRS